MVKPFKLDKDGIVLVRIVELCTHTSHDKRMAGIAFQLSGIMQDIVVKPGIQDIHRTVSARTVKLGTVYTCFLWQHDATYCFPRSGVKGQCYAVII